MTGIICSCQYFLIKIENHYNFAATTRQQIKSRQLTSEILILTTRWTFMQQELCSKSQRYHLTGHDLLSLHLSWHTVTASLWKQTFLPEKNKTELDWMIARGDSFADELFINSTVLGLANSFAACLYCYLIFLITCLNQPRSSFLSFWLDLETCIFKVDNSFTSPL